MGGGCARRPFLRVNEPKKTGARNAGPNPLVYNIKISRHSSCLSSVPERFLLDFFSIYRIFHVNVPVLWNTGCGCPSLNLIPSLFFYLLAQLGNFLILLIYYISTCQNLASTVQYISTEPFFSRKDSLYLKCIAQR